MKGEMKGQRQRQRQRQRERERERERASHELGERLGMISDQEGVTRRSNCFVSRFTRNSSIFMTAAILGYESLIRVQFTILAFTPTGGVEWPDHGVV